MKKIFFVLLILFSLETVNALEKCTPSDEYIKYMELSEEEREKIQQPIYCKEVMNRSSEETGLKKVVKLGKKLFTAKTDSKYNAMEDGYVTSVKNQLSLGTCWSFAATAAVESNALKNGLGTYDFSEAHMIYSLVSGGYSDTLGKKEKYITNNLDGGKLNYGASYYLNGYGQLNESEMPYPTYQKKITQNDYIQGKKMISVRDIEYHNLNSYSSCTTDELDKIKEQLVNYGAIQSQMYMDEDLFRDTNKNYYISTLSNSTGVNHAVTIIGWDDTISKSNFKNATRDGALIIKNSWGTNWSNDGIFYISYDDYFICKDIASYIGVSNTTYDITYKAADLVGLPEFMFSSTFYMSSNFTKAIDGKEKLKRVTFPVGQDMTYNIYLSKDGVLTSNVNWIKIATGSSNALGFKSIDLENIVLEDNFTIIAEYIPNSGKSSSVFTMCTNEEDTATMEISSNTNFYSLNSTNWYDLSSLPVGSNTLHCEPNFFAYTDDFSYTLELKTISTEDNITSMQLTRKKITDTDNITYKIYDSGNNDVTDSFIIEKDYTTNNVTIYSNNNISGTYRIVINYDEVTIEDTFEMKETFSVNNNTNMKTDKNNLVIKISNDEEVTVSSLIENLTIGEIEYKLLDSNNVEITDNTKIGTGTTLKVNDINFHIVVVGDVTGDGAINSADLLKVVKYLKGTVTLSDAQKNASDATRDKIINSADLLRVVKFLKGTTQFNI